MTRDELISVAKDLQMPYHFRTGEIADLDKLVRLVAIAEQYEREKCARLVEQAGIDGYGTLVAAVMIRDRSKA